MMTTPTIERLRATFTYDADTGALARLRQYEYRMKRALKRLEQIEVKG